LHYGCSFEIGFCSDSDGLLVITTSPAHCRSYLSVFAKQLGDITARALTCQDRMDRNNAIVCDVAQFKPRQKSTVFKKPGKDRAAGTGYLHTFIKHLAVHLAPFW
jgi:hypothetical protein